MRSACPDRETWAKVCSTRTCAQLQDDYQVSYWTVWNWCKRHDVPLPKGRKPGRKPKHECVQEVDAPQPIPSSARLSYWVQGGLT